MCVPGQPGGIRIGCIVAGPGYQSRFPRAFYLLPEEIDCDTCRIHLLWAACSPCFFLSVRCHRAVFSNPIPRGAYPWGVVEVYTTGLIARRITRPGISRAQTHPPASIGSSYDFVVVVGSRNVFDKPCVGKTCCWRGECGG